MLRGIGREAEVFHGQFLKMLGVCNSTPSCMLYGETGAYSIELLVRERIINCYLGNQRKLSAIMYTLKQASHYTIFVGRRASGRRNAKNRSVSEHTTNDFRRASFVWPIQKTNLPDFYRTV